MMNTNLEIRQYETEQDAQAAIDSLHGTQYMKAAIEPLDDGTARRIYGVSIGKRLWIRESGQVR